jgi:hypothetical protein
MNLEVVEMPEIAIELTYEKILEAASKLSEDDREEMGDVVD